MGKRETGDGAEMVRWRSGGHVATPGTWHVARCTIHAACRALYTAHCVLHDSPLATLGSDRIFPLAPTVPAVMQEIAPVEHPMASRQELDELKWFVFRHFERLLVVGLVLSLLLIHWLIDYKIAYLSFYYLPIIAAGFFLGRNAAVWSAVLIVALVMFFQGIEGLNGDAARLGGAIMLTLVPWGGFLILTGYAVGSLADQRKARLEDLKGAYVTLLELLTFHLESAETRQQGHSHRVASLAATLARELGLPSDEIEDLRVAALLHEIGPKDQRLLHVLRRFPGHIEGLPIADAMQGAMDILDEFERYFELVGDDWPIDRVGYAQGTKILAVADAFETLQMATPLRPAFGPWSAVEELEKSAGRIFASDVVQALRRVSAAPERRAHDPKLSLVESDTA